VVLGHEFSAEVVDYGPSTPHDLPVGAVVCSVPMLARQNPLAVGYSTEIPGGFAQYMVLSRSLCDLFQRERPIRTRRSPNRWRSVCMP
jgi:threonine dehydrogenase-like Zn-dependent dehydrogenase